MIPTTPCRQNAQTGERKEKAKARGMRAFAMTRKDISYIERDIADNSKQTAKERDLTAISRQVTRIQKQTTDTGLLFNVLYRLF